MAQRSRLTSGGKTWSLARCRWSLAAVLLAVSWSVLPSAGAQTQAWQRPRGVGELTGLWECVDRETRLTIRLVDCSDDGTYSEVIPPGVNRNAVLRGGYAMKNGLLTFSLTGPGSDPPHGLAGRAIVLEAGRVEWKDANMFIFTPMGGRQPRDLNRPCEFKRLDAVEDPARAGSIAGTWRIMFPIQQGIAASITLNPDGSYEDSHSRFNSPDPRYVRRYRYERSILTLLVASRNQPAIINRRGKVTWRDPDHFTLTLYSGDVLNVPTWKMEVECGRDGAAPRNDGDPPALAGPIPTPPAPVAAIPGLAGGPAVDITYGAFDDYVGTWDCTNAETHEKVRVVTFNADGTYRDKNAASGFSRDGRFRGDPLTLYLMEAAEIARKFGDGVAIREHGDVEWRGRDCFRFAMQDGTHLNSRFRAGTLLEFRRRAGSAPAAVLAAPAPLPQSVPLTARTQSRRIGEFAGLWKCKDAALDKTIRSVELRPDGTCEFCDLVQSFRRWTLTYRTQAGELAFPVPEKNMVGIDDRVLARFPGMAFVERGRVRWIDADLFRYELIDGRGVGPHAELHAGEVLEFHRAMGDSDPAKTGSLVGTWQQVDSRLNYTVGRYELHADGSYVTPANPGPGRAQQPIPRDPGTSRGEYQYSRDGVLTLTSFSLGRPPLIMMRGEVTWASPKEFTFTVVDGARVANISGDRFTFRRVEDE